MSQKPRNKLSMRVPRDTLVDDGEDGPLILGILDLSLPCRRFVVEHKVAEVGKISVTAEFLLRFVKALGSCSEEDAQTFFGYSRREMAYVLAEVEEADYVDRAEGRLSLTANGLGLFQPGSEDPLIFEVERKTARIGLDLLSLAPADSRSPSVFELNLPELPLVDPAQISSATDRVPVQFRRHFRELAPRMDSVAAARRSLYSIDGVSAEERFTNVVRVKLVSTGMKPMQVEVDLSDWRSDHELADREAVSRSVVQITERLGCSRREDDVDAYRLLIELAPEYFQEWTRRDGLSVQRFYRHAFTARGDVRADRQTTPIVGSLFTADNARRLLEVANYGLRRTKHPSPVLFWTVPQAPMWGSTSIMSEAVDQLRDLVMRAGDFREVEAIALTAGKPERWIKRGFTGWKESQSLVFPGGFEMLLAPCGFVAAIVHAPIGAPSGVPVPLGFASFNPRIVDRAMAMLASQAHRFGLDEALSQELVSPAAEPLSPDLGT
ncbi:hypothetical protein MNQ96_11395 [Sphingopyxis granuli]|uniref:hypothetical protein n=1 Tax=Sphingopyxis granuli TaxID=267128 RepID=UPI001F52EB54|nr:hypothetical protein [Sphingopyxis granuli]UNK78187.1 hypothetical protein MNQ96_11395 [Sphingopyxis granuli]